MKTITCAILASFPYCPDGSGITTKMAVKGDTLPIPANLVPGLEAEGKVLVIEADPAEMSREQLVEAAVALARGQIEAASDDELRQAVAYARKTAAETRNDERPSNEPEAKADDGEIETKVIEAAPETGQPEPIEPAAPAADAAAAPSLADSAFDHDGDGKPGGAPKGGNKAKAKAEG